MFGKKKAEGNPQRVLNQNLPIKAARIQATRALYQGEGFQTIETRIDTPQGDTLVIEMTPAQAHQLVGDLTVAYNVVNPPLNPPRFQA